MNSETYPPLSLDQKIRLLRIAREAIYYNVSRGSAPDPEIEDERLHASQGVFVSLHIESNLRGCIGTLIGDGPVYTAVADMAVSAANNDPRFAPLRLDEVPKLDIELTVLGPMQSATAEDVEIGTHGLFVTKGRLRGTLLPQVASQYGWNREEFLAQTCMKAGLDSNAWKEPECQLAIFTGEVFSESGIRAGN